MFRRNSGQSRRKRRICSRILVCSPALRPTTIEEGTVIPPTTRDKLALSGVADRNCRCHSLLQCVRPITWFDLEDLLFHVKKIVFETSYCINSSSHNALACASGVAEEEDYAS